MRDRLNSRGNMRSREEKGKSGNASALKLVTFCREETEIELVFIQTNTGKKRTASSNLGGKGEKK